MVVVRTSKGKRKVATLPSGKTVQYSSCMRVGVPVVDYTLDSLRASFLLSQDGNVEPEVCRFESELQNDVQLKSVRRTSGAEGKLAAVMPSATRKDLALSAALRDAKELCLKLRGPDTSYGWPVFWDNEHASIYGPYDPFGPDGQKDHIDEPGPPEIIPRGAAVVRFYNNWSMYLHMGDVPSFVPKDSEAVWLEGGNQEADKTKNQIQNTSPPQPTTPLPTILGSKPPAAPSNTQKHAPIKIDDDFPPTPPP